MHKYFSTDDLKNTAQAGTFLPHRYLFRSGRMTSHVKVVRPKRTVELTKSNLDVDLMNRCQSEDSITDEFIQYERTDPKFTNRILANLNYNNTSEKGSTRKSAFSYPQKRKKSLDRHKLIQ